MKNIFLFNRNFFMLLSAYWEWRTFRADQLPEFIFKATAPSYAKQYSTYMDQDGKYTFVGTNSLQATGQLSVTQNIPLTGGKVALNSSLDFLRQFDGGTANRFMSIPLALTLSQPLFSVNTQRKSLPYRAGRPMRRTPRAARTPGRAERARSGVPSGAVKFCHFPKTCVTLPFPVFLPAPQLFCFSAAALSDRAL